jgi:hypothetical protein
MITQHCRIQLRSFRSNSDVIQVSPLTLWSPRPSLASLDDIIDRELQHSSLPAASLLFTKGELHGKLGIPVEVYKLTVCALL